MDMDTLIRKIWTLRDEEGIPLHFRRSWKKGGKVVWYIWYGHARIAYATTLDNAWRAVRVAASVHQEANRI